MARKQNLAPGQYFHIYNRGVDKRDIFLTADDYRRFLILLYLCNNTEPVDIAHLFIRGLNFADILKLERQNVLVSIGAYCLMTNHVHLIIKPREDVKSFLFMQKLFTGYTMYFNKKYERTGALFESSFKAKLVDTDEYLKYLFAYIHLNPVKLVEPMWKEQGIKNFEKSRRFLENYKWSSYDFFNKKVDNSIININEFPEYFCNIAEFNDFLENWLNFSKFNF